jgi:uncharacterized membrane protein
MELLGDVSHVESRFSHFGDGVSFDTVLILIQDSCTVCTEHTVSSEIILDAPDGTRR